MVIPVRARRAYSHGPNFKASAAMSGAIRTKVINPNIFPIPEARVATLIAAPASPFLARGCPSNPVAIEEGVPGMFRRIADIEPPNTAATKIAIKKKKDASDGKPKVRGVNMARVMVEVSPGIEPKTSPIEVPNKIRRRILKSASIGTACP
jgi:hypothetical protein